MAWQINKVSAILLHEALKRLNSAIVFHSSHINWRPDQDSSSRRFDGCGSVGVRTSSFLPSRWKSTVDQSIPVKAWNTASSWIRSEGLISGHKCAYESEAQVLRLHGSRPAVFSFLHHKTVENGTNRCLQLICWPLAASVWSTTEDHHFKSLNHLFNAWIPFNDILRFKIWNPGLGSNKGG